jgi:hypothetical protein
MMADLIDRQAVVKAYIDLCLAKSRLTKSRKGVAFFQSDLLPETELTDKEWMRLINAAPAVDAVEVVRCKECIHSFKLRGSALKKESPYLYYRDDCTMCGCEALMGNIPEAVFDNFYCGYGEKRTNDGD